MIVGSGVDVVEIERFERVLARRGAAFERRVFRERELEAARRTARPALALALGFAAKEAALKALGTGWGQGAGFQDVEVRAGAWPGRPELVWHGVAAERLSGARAHAAVSHSRQHALALVLLEARR